MATSDQLYEVLYRNLGELDTPLKEKIISALLSSDKKFLGIESPQDAAEFVKRLHEQPVMLVYHEDDLAGVVSFGQNSKAPENLATKPYIRTIYVFPAYRKAGVASYILRVLLNSNKEWWAIVNKENIGALKLFCKFGFTKIGGTDKYIILASGKLGEGGIPCR